MKYEGRKKKQVRKSESHSKISEQMPPVLKLSTVSLLLLLLFHFNRLLTHLETTATDFGHSNSWNNVKLEHFRWIIFHGSTTDTNHNHHLCSAYAFYEINFKFWLFSNFRFQHKFSFIEVFLFYTLDHHTYFLNLTFDLVQLLLLVMK